MKPDKASPEEVAAPQNLGRLVLPLRHDRDEFADWGWVRDQTGAIVYQVKTPAGADLYEHRRAKTDPTQDRVDALLMAFRIVQRLAEWSEKYPRGQIHGFREKVDEQLIDIENSAKDWMDGKRLSDSSELLPDTTTLADRIRAVKEIPGTVPEAAELLERAAKATMIPAAPLRWTPAERLAIDRLKVEKDMNEPAILRQALRHYQAEHERQMGRTVELGPVLKPAAPAEGSAPRCDSCDWTFGCFDGSEPCQKKPKPTEGSAVEWVHARKRKLASALRRENDQITLRKTNIAQCDQLRAQLAAAQAEAARLREALCNLCAAVAATGGRHPKEWELLKESYDTARAALAKEGDEQ
jgi:hypothetical protein